MFQSFPSRQLLACLVTALLSQVLVPAELPSDSGSHKSRITASMMASMCEVALLPAKSLGPLGFTDKKPR